ncbi:9766_t:CDS:2, partial [Acaulospora colombiana]
SLASANPELSGNGTSTRQDQASTPIEDSFGPLEEWVDSYRQQHLRVFLEPVRVEYEDPSQSGSTTENWAREEKARVKTILQSAGFEHLVSSLTRPSRTNNAPDQSLLTRRSTLSGASRTSQARSSVLTVNSIASSSPSATSLATLKTLSPSCPACRGPVNIIFAKEPVTPSSKQGNLSLLSPDLTATQRYQRLKKLSKTFARGWWREFLMTVTGRSLLLRLVAQYSFLIFLVSMIKASGRVRQRK